MDLTDATKELVNRVQLLKPRYPDLASQTFIDFYCQCREGGDYLFPQGMRRAVSAIDILTWFFHCLEVGASTTLIDLMENDVRGPTLGEYLKDERVERDLASAFASSELKEAVRTWDRHPRSDGGVTLVLRNLLQDIYALEIEWREQEESPASA